MNLCVLVNTYMLCTKCVLSQDVGSFQNVKQRHWSLHPQRLEEDLESPRAGVVIVSYHVVLGIGPGLHACHREAGRLVSVLNVQFIHVSHFRKRE